MAVRTKMGPFEFIRIKSNDPKIQEVDSILSKL